MEKIFTALRDAIAQGEDTILATVTASSGATPRGAGARMLIGPQGRLAGTVGGGAVEFHSLEYAAEALATKKSLSHHFIMTKNEIEDIGMICGGNATVHYLFLDHRCPRLKAAVDLALTSIKERSYAWLVTDLGVSCAGGDSAGECVTDTLGLAVYRPADENNAAQLVGFAQDHAVSQAILSDPSEVCRRGRQIELAGRSFYTEELVIPGVVYIFGGGHVAQALVPALAAVDFATVVLDDRAEFVAPELFPGAFGVKLCDLDNIDETVKITDRDYVCIMTRGHSHDLEVEAQALKTPARYIGVIGSRHKIKTVNRILKERGYTDAELARITTPIGLDIGGETPAEIAVSITAQLIQERASDYRKIKQTGKI